MSFQDIGRNGASRRPMGTNRVGAGPGINGALASNGSPSSSTQPLQMGNENSVAGDYSSLSQAVLQYQVSYSVLFRVAQGTS